MCYPTDYTNSELRALLSDAIATAKRTRSHLDDALHALLTPSLTPATAPPIDDHSPVAAGASDPNHNEVKA